MTTADTRQLATQPQQEKGLTFAKVSEMTGYSLADIALIRQTRMPPNATLLDIALYLTAAKKLDLDPLLGQIHWIIRQGKGTHQTGIDGFRLVASRSNAYAGSEPPVFRGERELTHEGKAIRHPEEARVTVWRVVSGQKCAFTGTARWDEFYPGGKEGFMWRKMPFRMLGKCAEAEALRKGFPSELAGVPFDAVDQTEVSVTEQPRPALPRYEDVVGGEESFEIPPHVEKRNGNGHTEPVAEAEQPAAAGYTCPSCDRPVLDQAGRPVNDTQAEALKGEDGVLLCRDCREEVARGMAQINQRKGRMA